MIRTAYYPPREQWTNMLSRPQQSDAQLTRRCDEIFAAVRSGGDAAVKSYTKKYDGADISSLLVGAGEFKAAEIAVSAELKNAIKLAAANIEAFHSAQMPGRIEWSDGRGVKCWQEPRAIERIGLYVPGGTAPLFSTVLMLAIPARIAGCREVAICTPPAPDGTIHPAILWSAQQCGVRRIYKIGGIQAIAAMTLGTEKVAAVDKIFGPGNSYVMAAKQTATRYGVAIDMPAGPSEVLVVADGSARAEYVASDLLSQAEHGTDSQAILITWTPELIPRIIAELERQIASLPRRQIATRSLEHSMAVVVRNRAEALDIVNAYAPEHLILSIEDCRGFAERVINAGSVFLGNYSPESVGDYCSGTNHTLPTAGWARSYSGVNMDAFMKKVTFQEISREALERIGPAAMTMSRSEGLEAHASAIEVRLQAGR